MDAHQEVIEGEAVVDRDHDLAVEHEPLALEGGDRLYQLREVAPQRLARLRLELHFGAVAEDQAAETVPLRLVLPPGSLRDAVRQECLHGRIRRVYGKSHESASRR